MDEWRINESQCICAQVQFLAVLQAFGVFCQAIKISQHANRLGHTQEFGVRRQFQQTRQRTAVVRLHMVDDHIIQSADIEDFGQLGQIVIAQHLFGEVDQRGLFIFDQIGIIGNPFLTDRPKPLKEIGDPVVYPNPPDPWSDLNRLHKSSYLERYSRTLSSSPALPR